MSILLRQDETTECGLVCLAFASQMLGAEISIAELRRKYQISLRGLLKATNPA
ncbi:cysteine peptidase family C39 domain-containing protein [Undibacterium sp. Ji50W]|uniref:cysteine peptidase family C39 domain-containing protein n=1 Tax=Undibacterium sp. Ji50W TaxID=3413041 RepID=UPI003BF107A2